MSLSPSVYCIHKPIGPSSFQMVGLFKKKIGRPKIKIGHLGTLDPFASGLLIIGVGGALRINEYFNSSVSKVYRCVGKLGQKTDTADLKGTVIETKDVSVVLDLNQLEKQIQDKFIGVYEQSPPAYSAAKHKGKPLYRYAQEGIKIEKPPKKRFIHNLKVLSLKGDLLELECEVSTGTYIRTLFEDVAGLMGTCGHLVELERVSIGPFNLDKAIDLETMENEAILANAIRVDKLLELQKIHLDQQLGHKYSNGVVIRHTLSQGKYWVYSDDSKLLGLGEIDENHMLRPKINFS
ncbi:MAG: tRNA pseudouridine(55) synthase TruB [Bacteriovoracaceae bacterium]